jgi:enoyl-CoA hydratase/carnithine racemase
VSDHILVERADAVATVVLNRPQTHNAITVEMYRELPAVLGGLDDDPAVKAIVIRGSGQKAFASGADISEFERERGDAERARSYNEHVAAAERALEAMAKPTIAMVHGYCIGGGAGLALACDLRFADDRSRFAITPAKLGLVYSLESTKRVVDLVGPSRATWILVSGQQIPAGRALQLGLFDEVTGTDDLARLTYDFAELVTTRAQFSVRQGKQMVRRVVAGQRSDDEETRGIRNSSFDTADYAEGVRSFLEKRPPRFTWS